MFVYETGQLTNPRLIVNFPTKRHWRGKSRMEDIEAGLKALAETIRQYRIQSIAIPPLGSGLGGLDWTEVKPRIEAVMAQLPDVRVILFAPEGAPAAEAMAHHREAPKMTAGRAALVELMRRYLAGLLDPFITLLEVHKLMYFMQEAGEPLRLTFQKGHYDPYAENLRHVLSAIEGHLISGYTEFPAMPMAAMRRTNRLNWRPARLKTPRHSCNNTRIPAGVSTRSRRWSRDSSHPLVWNCWRRYTGYCNTNPCVQKIKSSATPMHGTSASGNLRPGRSRWPQMC